MILIAIIAVIYPAMIVFINPPPEEASLVVIPGKILSFSTDGAIAEVELKSGQVLKGYFPAPMYFIAARRPAINWLDANRRASLVGCSAQIGLRRMSFVWPERMQIWSVECAHGGVSYQELVRDYRARKRRADILEIVYVTFVLSLILVFYIKDRRGKWHR
ncbi:hypothetical protein ACNREE_08605 [Ralstonia pseudosolanacearum]|uniref:hypothetical protein n=1 Tax=Ralstonia pseudosolanacearum TaxID=1310165 RepID=UPI003AAB9E70